MDKKELSETFAEMMQSDEYRDKLRIVKAEYSAATAEGRLKIRARNEQSSKFYDALEQSFVEAAKRAKKK